jgi:hypothetical protein
LIAPIKRLLVLVAAIGALAAFPGIASAATCSETLIDPAGYTWDLDTDATIGDGGHTELGLSDAFDTFGHLLVSTNGGVSFTPYANVATTCQSEDNGREIAYPDNTTAAPGLTLSRKVYVPAVGTSFLRYVDSLTNTTPDPVTILYRFGGNFGSDGSTTIADSSSGDADVSERDSWVDTFEDSSSSTDPRNTNAWDGTSPPAERAVKAGRFDPETAGYAFGDDYLGVEYSVTLAPGETKRFMHVVAQRHTAEEQAAASAAIAAESDELHIGLSDAETATIRNWTFDRDADGVTNSKDNCPTDANAGQENQDGDAKGDACDDDIDGDGLSNAVEQALRTDPRVIDSDADGKLDGADSCPTIGAATDDGCPAAVVIPEVDKTAPLASLVVAKKVSLKKLLRKGIVVTVGANEPAGFELEIAAAAKSARLAQVGDLIVSAKQVAFGGGQRSVKLTIAKKFRKALRAKSRLRLKVVATDAAGNRTVTASGIKLVR